MAKLTRKCKVCGNEFDIYANDYVHFKSGYTEVNCFREYKLGKGNSEENIELQVEELLKVSREEKRVREQKELELVKKKVNSKRKEMDRVNNLDNLIKYLGDTYFITNFNNYFYIKLAQINRGDYKGITKGIPYEDLLDMFIKKQSYLDKVAFRNKTQGKCMTGIGRLNYDLAIIISKYDEYLKWKSKQKLIEYKNTEETKKDTTVIDYSSISKITTKNEVNDNVDITDILDDIY